MVKKVRNIARYSKLPASGRIGRIVKSFSVSTDYSLLSTVVWSGDDDIGRKVPSGVYFIQMNSDNYQSQHKVIFVH